VASEVEQAAVALAIEQPAWGQARASNELLKRGISISPFGVRSVWARHDLTTMKLRLRALEAKMAQERLILTESQLAALDHTRTKTKSPQTNGIVERFNKTLLDEFYRIAFRKKVYDAIAELQVDLDLWIDDHNQVRTHQGRYCFGKTPMQTFLDATPLARDKQIGGATPQTYAA